MRTTLDDAGNNTSGEITGPLTTYSNVALSDLVEHDSGIFLATCFSRQNESVFLPSDWLPNRSCWEQSINRIELGYGLSDCGPQILIHGISVAEIVRLKLTHAMPERQFIIRVSWNAVPFFETKEEYESTRKCVVSFWAYREGEAVFAPLEDFELEAIGELLVK